MSVDLVAIDNICELVRGSSPRPQGDPRYFGGSVPRLMVADMTRDGMYVTPSIDSLTEEGAKQSRPMKAGEVVMVVSGLVGLPSILKIDACIHDGLVGFRNLDKNVMPEYLYYWLLKSQEITRTQTAGAIWQNLTTDQIKEWKLPLPPLTEQKRIASLLARADRLRHLRRTAHDLGESLLQSVFLEMFGDPKTNPNCYDVYEMGEIGTLDRGRSKNRPRNAPELYGGKYPFIQTGDIANAGSYIKSYQQTYSDLGLKQSKMWKAGTLCITIAANIAKTAILTFDACFPDSVVGFVPNEKTNVEYVQYWLSFKQQELEDTAPESAQKNINLEILRGLAIPVPPLSLQEEFAGVVARVESLRGRMSEAGRQVDNLFESLLSQSFSSGGQNMQENIDIAFTDTMPVETFSTLDVFTVEDFISQLHILWDDERPKTLHVAEKAIEHRSSISGWLLSLTAEFQKKIKKCDKTIKSRIEDAIREIDRNPVQAKGDTLKPLTHLKGYWRYRIGKYRLMYFPDPNMHRIIFSDFDSRGGIYE